jgi:hypothetical protein
MSITITDPVLLAQLRAARRKERSGRPLADILRDLEAQG